MNLVLLRCGDVVRFQGQEWVVDMVNDCRARIQPLFSSPVVIKTRFGREKKIDRYAKCESITPEVEGDIILRRMTRAELDDWLTPKRPGVATDQTQGTQVEETDMPKKDKTKSTKPKSDLPTQGRAAAVHDLREKGVKKEEARERVQAKFNCPNGLFDRIWARDQKNVIRVLSQPEKKKAGGKKSAPAAKRKSSAPPSSPPPKSSPPPPPAPAEPVATA